MNSVVCAGRFLTTILLLWNISLWLGSWIAHFCDQEVFQGDLVSSKVTNSFVALYEWQLGEREMLGQILSPTSSGTKRSTGKVCSQRVPVARFLFWDALRFLLHFCHLNCLFRTCIVAGHSVSIPLFGVSFWLSQGIFLLSLDSCSIGYRVSSFPACSWLVNANYMYVAPPWVPYLTISSSAFSYIFLLHLTFEFATYHIPVCIFICIQYITLVSIQAFSSIILLFISELWQRDF